MFFVLLFEAGGRGRERERQREQLRFQKKKKKKLENLFLFSFLDFFFAQSETGNSTRCGRPARSSRCALLFFSFFNTERGRERIRRGRERREEEKTHLSLSLSLFHLSLLLTQKTGQARRGLQSQRRPALRRPRQGQRRRGGAPGVLPREDARADREARKRF